MVDWVQFYQILFSRRKNTKYACYWFPQNLVHIPTTMLSVHVHKIQFWYGVLEIKGEYLWKGIWDFFYETASWYGTHSIVLGPMVGPPSFMDYDYREQGEQTGESINWFLIPDFTGSPFYLWTRVMWEQPQPKRDDVLYMRSSLIGWDYCYVADR